MMDSSLSAMHSSLCPQTLRLPVISPKFQQLAGLQSLHKPPIGTLNVAMLGWFLANVWNRKFAGSVLGSFQWFDPKRLDLR